MGPTTLDRPLSGKVAVVTGASSGIGLATARVLADAGALLVVAARSNEKLEHAARDLGGTATAVPTDVTSTREVDHLVARTIELHGRIDILIANAGIYAGATSSQMTSRSYCDSLTPTSAASCARSMRR